MTTASKQVERWTAQRRSIASRDRGGSSRRQRDTWGSDPRSCLSSVAERAPFATGDGGPDLRKRSVKRVDASDCRSAVRVKREPAEDVGVEESVDLVPARRSSSIRRARARAGGTPLGRAIHRARKREASTACRRLSQLTPSHRRCHVAPRRHAAGGRAIHHKASAPPCRHAFQVNSVIHSLSTETLLNKALIAGRRQCSSSSLSLCSTLATHLMAALTTKALRTVDFTRRPL